MDAKFPIVRRLTAVVMIPHKRRDATALSVKNARKSELILGNHPGKFSDNLLDKRRGYSPRLPFILHHSTSIRLTIRAIWHLGNLVSALNLGNLRNHLTCHRLLRSRRSPPSSHLSCRKARPATLHLVPAEVPIGPPELSASRLRTFWWMLHSKWC